VAVIIVAAGVVFYWLLRDKKRAIMLLTAETTEALTAARADLAEHDKSAKAALAAMTAERDELKKCHAAAYDLTLKLEKERDELAKKLKVSEAQLATLQSHFGLAPKEAYTDEEIERATKKYRQVKALGGGIPSMFADARRRGILP
jgi:septal ring factor EnvC (AmiA/AmiB activator)